MSDPATPIDVFLRCFFGVGNDLKWEKVRSTAPSGPIVDRVRPFLQQAAADWDRLILPRVQQGRVTWYALARSAQDARVLREELLAFVGPSYTNFRGQYAALDPADEIEAAIAGLGGANVFRLDVVDPALKDDCRVALQRLLEVRARRPRGNRAAPRPPGRVLRDFELAVQSSAEAEALGYLCELREHGGTSARNLRFLEVHLADSLDNQPALAAMLADGALVQARRPIRVTKALIRAVYRQELAAFEVRDQPEEALRHFKAAVLPRFGRLFQSLAGLDGPEVIKSFLLLAATSRPPNPDRRDFLLDRSPASALDRPYVEALGRLTPNPPPLAETPLAAARRAFTHGDLDTALCDLLALEPSDLVLDLLIRCALEVDTVEAAASALAYWERAPADLRKQVESQPRLAKALAGLRRFSAPASSVADSNTARPTPSVPGSWPEWLLRLRSEPLWPGAVQTASHGAAEWAVSEAGTPEEIATFAASLRAELSPPAQSRLALSLPYILDFFVHRGAGIGAFLPVQHALFERLLYADGMSIETLRSAGLLLDALMRGGLDRPKCALALEDLRSSWRDLPSFELLDWALDVFESIVTLQVVPEEGQTRFAMALVDELLRWKGRLTRSQVELFEQLCREARIECHAGSLWSPPDEETSEPPPRASSPKSIALYSLRPEVLSRVANVVASVWPGTNVRVFSDHVGNDALRTAARTADLFVIVTGAAKHAATEFIEANRPAGAATIRCHATGSAAVLRLLGLD